MGWFKKIPNFTDHMRLEILMQYKPLYGVGCGAVRWFSISPHPLLSNVQSCIAITALNYGRALVNHAETREALFGYIGEIGLNLVNGNNVVFNEWQLDAGGMKFYIWPWDITEAEKLSDPKIYNATLQSSKKGFFVIHLDMAFGLERILAPSAALLPIFVLADRLDEKHKLKMGSTLLAMNNYYKNPDGAGELLSEVKAFNHAIPALIE
jgi:hypothetical protein